MGDVCDDVYSTAIGQLETMALYKKLSDPIMDDGHAEISSESDEALHMVEISQIVRRGWTTTRYQKAREPDWLVGFGFDQSPARAIREPGGLLFWA